VRTRCIPRMLSERMTEIDVHMGCLFLECQSWWCTYSGIGCRLRRRLNFISLCKAGKPTPKNIPLPEIQTPAQEHRQASTQIENEDNATWDLT